MSDLYEVEAIIGRRVIRGKVCKVYERGVFFPVVFDFSLVYIY